MWKIRRRRGRPADIVAAIAARRRPAAGMNRARIVQSRFFPILAIVLVAGCGRSAAADEIILRDGSVKRGELSACTTDACTLSGASIVRPDQSDVEGSATFPRREAGDARDREQIT